MDKLSKILAELKSYQAEYISRRIRAMEKYINELHEVIMYDTEELGKYVIISAMSGINRLNHNNYSLDGLSFVYEHKNSLSEDLNVTELLSLCDAYDLYCLINKKKPKRMFEIRSLYKKLRSDKNINSIKELNEHINDINKQHGDKLRGFGKTVS